CRWYVFPSTIVVPSARSSSGSTVFTVALVPTGMNAGVGRSPCAVRSTPARAAPSVAVTANRSLIDAHVTAVDDEVAAMLEAEVFVVGADAGIVTEAVEAKEPPVARGRGRVRPFHERATVALPGACVPDRESV